MKSGPYIARRPSRLGQAQPSIGIILASHKRSIIRRWRWSNRRRCTVTFVGQATGRAVIAYPGLMSGGISEERASWVKQQLVLSAADTSELQELIKASLLAALAKSMHHEKFQVPSYWPQCNLGQA